MKLIFVGAQGCGKGTQAKIVAERLGLCHISSGDALRKVTGNGSQVTGLGAEVKSYMDDGKLVPDELIVRILKERIAEADCEKGFILDGFPRNLSQALELDKITEIDKVIEIFISDELSVRRISGRMGCEDCGAIYNVNGTPKPVIEGKCDKCGGELLQRADDNESALRERLKVYHEETMKVLEHYGAVRVDGEQDIERVTRAVLEAIGVRG